MTSVKLRRQKADSRRRLDRAAQWVKQRLIEAIAGEGEMPRCNTCGDHGVESPLTVDHVNGKAWRARSTDQATRVLRYIAEFQAGVALQVLCFKCNSVDGIAQAKRGHRVADHAEVLP